MHPYVGELSIPENNYGEYSVVHVKKPASWTTSTANHRCALIGGQERECLKFEGETRWHELRQGDGVWMSDLPCEQAQHDRLLKDFHGVVLVGGLGLGYAVKNLSRNPNVEKIVVIEKSIEVINLVWPYITEPFAKLPETQVSVFHCDGTPCIIFCCDLFAWLNTRPAENLHTADCAFYDIWTHDDEKTFHDVVIPLRLISRDIPKVECWNEDVMRGQLLFGLQGHFVSAFMELKKRHPLEFFERLSLPRTDEGGAKFHNWRIPFFASVAKRIKSGRKLEMDEYMHAATIFVNSYGVVDEIDCDELWSVNR